MAEQIPGIDVIIYGHTHSELPEKIINGVLLTEAKYWGQSLARADVTMTKGADRKLGSRLQAFEDNSRNSGRSRRS